MTNNFRVSNLSRGYSLKQKAAERAVAQCAAVWVEYGVSIRDLTLAESIAARAEQAKMRAQMNEEQARLREPLPYVEIHGLRYEPSAGGYKSHLEARRLVWEAHVFAAKACGAA